MNEKISKRDGIEFLHRTWKAENEKAKILIVHGLGEHCGRYEETAYHLNKAGISVHSYDRRGEGASGGKRAHISDFTTQVEDLNWVYDNCEKNDKPFFIYGHSLGGLIVTTLLTENPSIRINGAILSGPLLKVDEEISPLLQKVSGIVSALLPYVPTVKVDTDLISRVAEERQKYINDPLVYHGATNARTGHIILQAIKNVQHKFSLIKHPLLIMHGGGDKLADPQGSRWLYEKAASTDKKLHIFEGWYHEIMREPEKEQFFSMLLDWLEKRIDSAVL